MNLYFVQDDGTIITPRTSGTILEGITRSSIIELCGKLGHPVEERAVDIDVQFGPDYGRSLGHAKNPPAGLQKARIVKRIDLDRFWKLYADLLTRPVPGG